MNFLQQYSKILNATTTNAEKRKRYSGATMGFHVNIKEKYMEATNSHILVRIPITPDEGDYDEGPVVINYDVVKEALKNKKSYTSHSITVGKDSCSIDTPFGVMTYPHINLSFPGTSAIFKDYDNAPEQVVKIKLSHQTLTKIMEVIYNLKGDGYPVTNLEFKIKVKNDKWAQLIKATNEHGAIGVMATWSDGE